MTPSDPGPAPRHVAVIDIGKTNAKLALVDMATLTEIAVITRPNTVRPGPPWPHFDTQGHWDFLLTGLAGFHRSHVVDAITATTHGASIVLLDAQGDLAAPILDYEHPGPETAQTGYARICPPFSQTGSPRQANGLSVGRQMYWQFTTDPGLRDRVAAIVTYPQYWTFRLSGVQACDVTSIGCHTDLWEPGAARFSDLVDRLGIGEKIAPVRRPMDVLGPILPQVAQATGLPRDTPVMCGIHDSNASLYPHLLSQTGAFSVVSTGTWVVVMSIGGAPATLDPDRDTLFYVNALGDPVPSARFLGGREFDLLGGGSDPAATPADMADVADVGPLLMPAVEPSAGPFQGREARWVGQKPAPGTGMHAAALAFYLALMTEHCLDLTQASGPVLVEGPFARNAAYLAMLGAVTGRPVLTSAGSTGTSIGAALLVGGEPRPDQTLFEIPSGLAPALCHYAARWQAALRDHP